MPLWTCALLLSFVPPVSTLTLYRGCELPGQALRYWAAEDTVLDSAQADGNFGGSPYLSCGPGKTLLIRFGDLRRALGPNKRIAKASLTFSITGGDRAGLSQAGELLVPWGEGPSQVVTYNTTPPNLSAPAWSASWKNRRSGEGAIPWQQPGASGVGDAKSLPDVKAVSPDNDHIRIEGLAASLQRHYDRPFALHGWLFRFDAPVEFGSSQGRETRPSLEIEYEDLGLQKGPDLAVVRITRTPEYPRYSPPASPLKVTQDGIAVELPFEPANFKEKHWPANGEEVAYTAVIKNLGDAPAQGYAARWIVREKPGSALESTRSLAPGEEATLTYRSTFRSLHADHRLQPLALHLESAGPDTDPSNNGIAIHENALSVRFSLTEAEARTIKERVPLGADTLEEWGQALIGLWNETILPQSRFSFAPDGALERLRLIEVNVAGATEEDLAADIAIHGAANGADLTDWIKEIGRQLGLADLSRTNFTIEDKKLAPGGLILERGSSDLFPGLMGGGDTRNDGFVPAMLTPPYEPLVNAVFDVLPMEATDLLSATDVALLNSALGYRRGLLPEGLLALPPSTIVRILDLAGAPVKNATVEVYQLSGGVLKDAKPLATLNTGTPGSIVLPNRPSGTPEGHKTPLGKTLAPNPFGVLDPTGSNGMLVLKVNSEGTSDCGFVKAWQLADAFRRSPTALVFDVRVNVGADVDRTNSLAKNRIVTDSSNLLPAKLAAVVDEKPSTSVELPAGKDAWIEIDLGRDRVFGEIRISAGSGFWEKFSIMAYATGQTASDAKAVAREASWSWAYANRSDTEEGSARSVAYRTSGVRARFIRLVASGQVPVATLAEVKVFPARAK